MSLEQKNTMIQIFLKFNGETIVTELLINDKFSVIKDIIISKYGISPEQIYIVYNGKIPRDDLTLADLNVQKNETIDIRIRQIIR